MAEALAKSNASELGLTAGFYSADQAKIDELVSQLSQIDAESVEIDTATTATAPSAAEATTPEGGFKLD